MTNDNKEDNLQRIVIEGNNLIRFIADLAGISNRQAKEYLNAGAIEINGIKASIKTKLKEKTKK